MRFKQQRTMIAALVLGCLALVSAGCASGPPSAPSAPAQPPAPVHAMIDMQKLLELHPARATLRQMEQSLNAMDAAAADNSAELEIANREFEAAMKVRQHEEKAALEEKQRQLETELNGQRRLFVDALEAEYRPLLFNYDLKLKTVQLSTAQKETLQKERDRLEAERLQKLSAKDAELSARFQKEMESFAAELSGKSEAYARQWMGERRQSLQKPVVSPEREKQRQQIVELSGRMIQDIRAAVTKIAVQEKIEMVWLRPAVHSPLKDITDAVAREIANVK